MSMTRKDFIALAEYLIDYTVKDEKFLESPIFKRVVKFCKSQNYNFCEYRFKAYCKDLIEENGV